MSKDRKQYRVTCEASGTITLVVEAASNENPARVAERRLAEAFTPFGIAKPGLIAFTAKAVDPVAPSPDLLP